MRNGSAANTLPGSVRCRPSTRMSLMTKGATARAEGAMTQAAAAATTVTAARAAPRGNAGNIGEGTGRRKPKTVSVEPEQAGYVVVKRHRHHQQQHRDAAALQAREPLLRHRAPRGTFEN